MTPELIMLVGAPCSGKSTWRRLNLSDDYVLIDTDSYIERRATEMGQTYEEVFKSEISNAEKDMMRRLRTAVAMCKNIVWDQTNMTRRARTRKLSLIPQFYNRAAVVFGLDEDELMRRNRQRAKETGKRISETIIRSMLNSFEMPTGDEGYNLIVDAGVVKPCDRE